MDSSGLELGRRICFESFGYCSRPCLSRRQQIVGMAPSGSSLFSDDSIYCTIEAIGSGAYGSVYKAKDPVNEGKFVALKKLEIDVDDEGVPQAFLREIGVFKYLAKFQHPNIVQLRDVCLSRVVRDQQQTFVLVLELVDQDLRQYLSKVPPQGLDVYTIKSLMKQIVCGVDFLHSHRIIHRDIKPQNILVTHGGVVKLADFGLARLFHSGSVLNTNVVTLWYRAPEVLLNVSYNSAVDIWSVGCVLAELFTRKPLFPGRSETEQLAKILNTLGSPEEDEWPVDSPLPWSSVPEKPAVPFETVVLGLDSQGKDLLLKLLAYAPGKRISALEALKHPFLTDVMVPIGPVPSSGSGKPLGSPTKEKNLAGCVAF